MAASDPQRPVLVYDGGCSFCQTQAGRLERLLGERITFASFRKAETLQRFPGLDPARCAEAIQLVEPGGLIREGPEALAKAIEPHPLWGFFGDLYHFPGVSWLAPDLYSWLGRLRLELPPTPAPSSCPLHRQRRSHGLTSWLFLRLLGLIYIVAFASFAIQARGLVGSRGLMPLAERIAPLKHLEGLALLRAFPSIFWWFSSDEALVLVPLLGIVLSLVLIANRLPRLMALLLWLLYLSVVKAGQSFFYFQWDNLLLETGLLAVFLAPRGLAPGIVQPHGGALFLLRYLFFRLFFESGVAKLHGGDPGWRDMSAMLEYYETAPLPTWGGWLVHQLPAWGHKLTAFLTLAGELCIPMLIFFGRRLRLLAFLACLAFQAVIIFSANYGFFNYLSGVIALLLLDDGHLRWLAQRGGAVGATIGSWLGDTRFLVPPKRPLRVLGLAVTLSCFSLASLDFVEYLGSPKALTGVAAKAGRWFGPLRSFNTYHLFVSMTRKRLEVELEGSSDGETWRSYHFHHKPGPLQRRPDFVAPHQPRLDFQLWFLTLSWGRRRHAYFETLLDRVCKDPPAVAAFFAENPFPKRPPKALRIAVYRYRFGNFGEWWSQGSYWRRELLGHHPKVIDCKEGADN